MFKNPHHNTAGGGGGQGFVVVVAVVVVVVFVPASAVDGGRPHVCLSSRTVLHMIHWSGEGTTRRSVWANSRKDDASSAIRGQAINTASPSTCVNVSNVFRESRSGWMRMSWWRVTTSTTESETPLKDDAT